MNFDEAYRKQYGRAPFEGVTEWDGRDRYSVPSQAAARPAAPGSAAWPPPGVRDPSEGGRTDSSAEREVDLDLADPLSPLYRADDLGDEAHAETGMIHGTEKQGGLHMDSSQIDLALTDTPTDQTPAPPAEPEGTAHPLSTELAAGMGQAPTSVAAFKNNLAMMHEIRKAVLDTLVSDKDFGLMPGVKKPFLYENGAYKIGIGFNVYAIHDNREREGTDTNLEKGITFPVYEVTSRAKLIWRHNGETAFIGPECVCSSAEGQYVERLWDHPNKWGDLIKAVPLGAMRSSILHQAQKRASVEAIRNFSGAGDRFTQDPDIVKEAGGTTTPEQVGERKTERPVVKMKAPTPTPAPAPAPAPAAAAQPAQKATPPTNGKPTKERFSHLFELCAKVTPRTTVPALMAERKMPTPLLDVDCMKLIAELEAKLKGGTQT